MTIRKALFFCWGVVYWPVLIVALVFLGIANGLHTVGEWLHDVVYDWAYPLPKPVALSCESVTDSMLRKTSENKA